MTMKEDVQPKKRSEKIIISISGETSEWLELYCKTDGIPVSYTHLTLPTNSRV